MRSYQKCQLEKLVIFYENINSTVHKPKLLSLKGLERIRNWKKGLDSHLECDVSEFVWSSTWCCSQWISRKKLSSISLQKRGFPNPRPTQLKLSDSFFLLLSLSEVAEVPGLPFGTRCLGSPTSKGFCPNIRSFFSSKRHTDLSTMQAKYYLAEQEIPRWSGGILKGWSDFLQNTSLAPMETEVCYL